ncbi:hypothetical protein Tco_0852362 [Tanacetum coccineum]
MVITTNSPYASAASTPTGANTGGSSFVYLGGQIPIDASTLPNADLPSDPNMPALEDDFDVFPNDGIFSGAFDDEDVGVEADFNNIDNTIFLTNNKCYYYLILELIPLLFLQVNCLVIRGECHTPPRRKREALTRMDIITTQRRLYREY